MYTKRARIFVGTMCNARCRFCYYITTGLNEKRPMEDIKRQLDIARNAGMKAIDFSGGEPSAIPEIVEMTGYAKSLGFSTIGMVTNGLRLANAELVKKLAGAGMNDFLFSIHGHNEEEHEYLTRHKGSFKSLMRSIRNLKELGIPFRINCTVTKINYRSLEEHAKLYSELEPMQVNFILFNDWETASSIADEFCVGYSEAAPFIKKAIEILRTKIHDINVRYIPYCFMNGYEQYVCDYSQKIHDPFEWSQRMLIRLDAQGIWPKWKYYLYLLYGALRFLRLPHLPYDEYLEDVSVEIRKGTYIKPNECKHCMYYELCDGLEKSYVRINGTNELKPEFKEKIKDVLYYRRDFYSSNPW